MRWFFAFSSSKKRGSNPSSKKKRTFLPKTSSVDDQDLDDATLVERVKQGYTPAFRILMARHQSSIYQLCLRMLKTTDEAEDLTQEAFIRAHRALSQFRHQSSFSTWLYRIALNLCKNRIDYLKRRQRDAVKGIEDFQGQGWENQKIPIHLQSYVERPDEAFAFSETQHLIQEALNQLDESLRVLIILRDLEGLDYKQIANITQRPLNTVKSRLHVARMRLMNYYKALASDSSDSEKNG